MRGRGGGRWVGGGEGGSKSGEGQREEGGGGGGWEGGSEVRGVGAVRRVKAGGEGGGAWYESLLLLSVGE